MASEMNASGNGSETAADATSVTTTVLPAAKNLVNTSFGHPLTTVLTVKLDEKNYLLWRGMVLAILRGQRVERFVLGTKAQPSEFLDTTSGSEFSSSTPNPMFEEWTTIDQALCGWLFGSMTATIAADVVSCSTSREVWKAIEQMYGATCRARINQLRGSLQNTKKGAMKMLEYLALIKQTSESLKLAGAPVLISDLTSYILCGLGPEYLPIVCIIESQEVNQWKTLHSQLITFEGTLERLHMNPVMSDSVTEHTANFAQNRNSSKKNWQGNGQSSTGRGPNNNNRGRSIDTNLNM